MNEPFPYFTSTTRLSAPAASFRLKTLAVINGRLGMLPHFCRRAKRVESVGAISLSCSMIAQPILFSWSTKSPRSIFFLKPLIAESFWSVLISNSSSTPLIVGITTPQAAARGANTMLVLSPTPPVENLSIFGRLSLVKSIISPESIISSAKVAVSCADIPWK